MPTQPPGTPTWRWSIALRGSVLLIVSTFLLSGIVLRQGLGVRKIGDFSTGVLQTWRMFSGVGRGLTQVRFKSVGPDAEVIDRYEVLGVARLDQPEGVWRVRGLKGARRLARLVCEQLPAGSVLELEARTAHASGWRNEDPLRVPCN